MWEISLLHRTASCRTFYEEAVLLLLSLESFFASRSFSHFFGYCGHFLQRGNVHMAIHTHVDDTLIKLKQNYFRRVVVLILGEKLNLNFLRTATDSLTGASLAS
jgi:hypothetical protein